MLLERAQAVPAKSLQWGKPPVGARGLDAGRRCHRCTLARWHDHSSIRVAAVAALVPAMAVSAASVVAAVAAMSAGLAAVAASAVAEVVAAVAPGSAPIFPES